MKKFSLDLEALAVDSFETTVTDAERGTVLGRESVQPTPPEPAPEDDCTYKGSCLCETAYYYCGTGPFTIYSCNFTNDNRCNTADRRCTRWC